MWIYRAGVWIHNEWTNTWHGANYSTSLPFLHLQNNRIKLYLCAFNSKNSWTPSVQSLDLYQEIKYLFSNIWRPSRKMVICFNLYYFLEQWVVFNIRNNFPSKEQDDFGVICSLFLEKHRQKTDYSFFFFIMGATEELTVMGEWSSSINIFHLNY